MAAGDQVRRTGEQIRRARETRGLSREELAAKIPGVSGRTIQRLEAEDGGETGRAAVEAFLWGNAGLKALPETVLVEELLHRGAAGLEALPLTVLVEEFLCRGGMEALPNTALVEELLRRLSAASTHHRRTTRHDLTDRTSHTDRQFGEPTAGSGDGEPGTAANGGSGAGGVHG